MDLVLKISSLVLLFGIILFVVLPAGVEDYILIPVDILFSIFSYLGEEFYYNLLSSWKGILSLIAVPFLWVMGMMSEVPC